MIHNVPSVGHHLIFTISYQFPISPSGPSQSIHGLALGKAGLRGVLFGMLLDQVCGQRTMLESDLEAEEGKGLTCLYRKGHQGLRFLLLAPDSFLPP